MIERLESTLEKPADELATMEFHFDIHKRGGNDVLSVKDISLSYDSKPVLSILPWTFIVRSASFNRPQRMR